MSATSQARSTASRAANSKPLEYLARAGFVAYGVIHLLLAWLVLQVAFGSSSSEGDQSGALRTLAQQPAGGFLLVLIAIGMIALALWQAFEAVVGESGPRGKAAAAERFISVCRTVMYGYFAYLAIKVLSGSSTSQASKSEQTTSTIMDNTGGRWLIGVVGLVVAGVGIGLVVYGLKKKFEEHLNIGQMSASVRRTVRRLGMTGYSAKGVAYGIAGVLVVSAAVTYDPDKARGLDAALKTLAGNDWGPWLLALIALGFLAHGVYCFFQVRYRKV
ncbi:DUF1206 domain-containing protein [Mangrovihabitans endophyticus]|nr:DUF1206 domain-containing protein [Mangrovihabitans endophyticus]